MQALYFLAAGIVLYFVSDWILNRIEIARGERLENRTLIFFGILLVGMQVRRYSWTPLDLCVSTEQGVDEEAPTPSTLHQICFLWIWANAPFPTP